MGVKDLWSILSPLGDRKPLFELQGKTVAIDASCWIVDSETIIGHSPQAKIYLRNLYFRTAILLMHGVSPVFVLEGKPPKLKQRAMERRNELRFGLKERKRSKRGSRPRLKRILSECSELLRILGLTCVQGHGEAEAMCAYLNADGLVDGCVSQDSDCFLYGAKVVYRNFCCSRRGNRGASNGAVDEYRLQKIEEKLNLGRKEMIALALLCGCDYSDGIQGVGKEAALKLFKFTKDRDTLEVIKGWRREDRNFCTFCGKAGCKECETTMKCHDFYRERKALELNELALKKKSLAVEDFPNQELIDEFLVRKGPVPTEIDVEWKQPQLAEFIVFMQRHLSWDATYAFRKIFPLATRWQLTRLPRIRSINRPKIPNLFVPDEIKGVRNVKSIASYKISWKPDDETTRNLREVVEAFDESRILSELFSVEPREAVEKCYPDLVSTFERLSNGKTRTKRPKTASQSRETSSKPRSKKRHVERKKNATPVKENVSKTDEFSDSDISLILEDFEDELSVAWSESKLPERPRKNSDPNSNPPNGSRKLLNDSFDKMFDELSSDDFNSDVDDLNMSKIIDDICGENDSQFDAEVAKNHADEVANDLIVINDEEELNENEIVEIGDDSDDEFASIDEAYVPLNKRILTTN